MHRQRPRGADYSVNHGVSRDLACSRLELEALGWFGRGLSI
jgi:hypothetical protein